MRGQGQKGTDDSFDDANVPAIEGVDPLEHLASNVSDGSHPDDNPAEDFLICSGFYQGCFGSMTRQQVLAAYMSGYEDENSRDTLRQGFEQETF